MKCLAIIPARGGSKGIPRKNVLPLAGKPLIAYSIEQAHLSEFVEKVIVSTDDQEIANVSKKYGADVIMRPDAISGDSASSEAALLHVLDYLQEKGSYEPEIIVFLQCTSPLTLAEDIDGAIQSLIKEDADSCVAVSPFHYFIWRSEESGYAEGINHEKSIRKLRQNREPQYLETGAIYVMRAKGFLAEKHRFFGKTSMYVMPAERTLEIDEHVDFEIADLLMRKRVEQMALKNMIKEIDALILDFDGVFTDNRVLVFQDGKEAVLCDRSDGMGISELKKTGVKILVLSTETNAVVQQRSKKLGIPCLNGIEDKWKVLEHWLDSRGLDPQKTVYVGNDVNDSICMNNVGCSIAVADSHPTVLREADIVLKSKGGQGAIREVCDLIKKKISKDVV